MSANRTPSSLNHHNHPNPRANQPASSAPAIRLNRIRCAPRFPESRTGLPRLAARSPDLLRVPLLPCSTRTCDGDRACLQPSRLSEGPWNSRFRFEVPARIACLGGKCREARCDPAAIKLQSSGRESFSRFRLPRPLLPRHSAPLHTDETAIDRQLSENITIPVHVKLQPSSLRNRTCAFCRTSSSLPLDACDRSRFGELNIVIPAGQKTKPKPPA